MPQRILLCIATTATVSLILLVTLYQTEQVPWSRLTLYKPHANSWLSALKSVNSTSAPQNSSEHIKGPPVVTPSQHPNTTLVLATLSYTDNSWIDAELGDILGPPTNLYTAIYVVNDERAPLHTPANKGHEAMAYLTYLIDFYDNLPEISIFMHGHPGAWHNDIILSMSSSEIVRNLDRSKVLKDGYFNLRCHWTPGCQPGIDPSATKYDEDKKEEMVIGEAWRILFPFHEVPELLAQPCCSQFAVSREAIHAHPVERYVQFRHWLLESRLSDYITGRVFEYFWHWIFKGVTTLCPDPRICYCEGYGVCFEHTDDYGKFFRLGAELNVYRSELTSWGKWTNDKTIERRDEDESDGEPSEPGQDWVHDEILALSEEIWRPRRKSTQGRKRGTDFAALEKPQNVIVEDGPDPAEVGQAGREEWLQTKIDETIQQLDQLKAAFFEAGKDPLRRKAALEATRRINDSWDNEMRR